MNPESRLFRTYIAVGLVGIGLYFLLPQPLQNLALILSNVTALAVILLTWWHRRLRPTTGWMLLAAFPAATAVGNTVYFVNESILDEVPFPSIGDVSFLGGYLFLAAGLLRLQQARSGKRDLPAILDTAIITIGFGAASWVVFMAPLLHHPDQTLWARLTALGYPVADVLILAVAARFFFTSRRRGPVFTWLFGTVVVMLAADTVFAVLNLVDVYQTGSSIDVLILAYNLGWGAVVLHPGSADLSRPADTVVRGHGRPRLAALMAATATAPVVLIILVGHGEYADVPVAAGAATVLFLLVVARMGALVRALETVLAERRSLEVELEHRAHHDDLTGLANRRMFVDQLEQALQGPRERRPEVLFIDLDRFKAINDSLGHGAGDALLALTARRLLAELRSDDTVARVGGDEFAVLLGSRPPHAHWTRSRRRWPQPWSSRSRSRAWNCM